MKKKKAIAIVLGGGRGTRLYPLTMDRAKPAVPFAGNTGLLISLSRTASTAESSRSTFLRSSIQRRFITISRIHISSTSSLADSLRFLQLSRHMQAKAGIREQQML